MYFVKLEDDTNFKGEGPTFILTWLYFNLGVIKIAAQIQPLAELHDNILSKVGFKRYQLNLLITVNSEICQKIYQICKA